MCTWEPLSGQPSPDRLDACVYALTELAVGGGPLVFTVPESEFVIEPLSTRASWRSN
jgi:hypothetical protein